MNNRKVAILLGLALVLGAAATALVAGLPRPVARVNGQTISSEELSLELRERFGPEVLQDLVTERLIAQAARQYGLDVSGGEISQWVADFQQQPEARALLDSGRLTRDRLRRNLTSAVPLYYLALQDTPEEARKEYFRAHRELFEELRLRHILLGSEQEALDLRQRLQGPADFSTLASVHSLDDRTRPAGGDLGRVTRAELEESFPEAEVAALFALAPGSVSPPLQARSGGWHLFLVEGRTVDYQSLRRRVVADMASQRVDACLEALRARARVEILQPSLRATSSPSGSGTSPTRATPAADGTAPVPAATAPASGQTEARP